MKMYYTVRELTEKKHPVSFAVKQAAYILREKHGITAIDTTAVSKLSSADLLTTAEVDDLVTEMCLIHAAFDEGL